MPGCIYKIRERVLVPNVLGVQGIVTSCLESIDKESAYTVRWFDENALAVDGIFAESDIVRAEMQGRGLTDEAVKTALPANEFKPAAARQRSRSKRKGRR